MPLARGLRGLLSLSWLLAGCVSVEELGLPEPPEDATFLVLVDSLGEPSARAYGYDLSASQNTPDQPLVRTLAEPRSLTAFYYALPPSVAQRNTGPLEAPQPSGVPLPQTEHIFLRPLSAQAFSAASPQRHASLREQYLRPAFDFSQCLEDGGCAGSVPFEGCKLGCLGLGAVPDLDFPQVPCPEGWVREEVPDGPDKCAPALPALLGCPAGERQPYGASACAPLMPCAQDQEWPPAPAAGEVAYVRPGAQGDGRTEAAPLGSIAAALADPRGVDTIVLSAGVHPSADLEGRTVRLRGVCPSRTTVLAADGPLRIDGGDVRIEGLRLEREAGVALIAREQAKLTIQQVEVSAGQEAGLRVLQSELILREVSLLHRPDGALDVGSSAVVNATEVFAEGGLGLLRSGARGTLRQCSVKGSGGADVGAHGLIARGGATLDVAELLLEDLGGDGLLLGVASASIVDLTVIRAAGHAVFVSGDSGTLMLERVFMDHPGKEALALSAAVQARVVDLAIDSPLQQAVDVDPNPRIDLELRQARIFGSLTTSTIKVGQVGALQGPIVRLTDVKIHGTDGTRVELGAAEVRIESGEAHLNRVQITDSYMPGVRSAADTYAEDLYIRRVLGFGVLITNRPAQRRFTRLAVGANSTDVGIQIGSPAEPLTEISDAWLDDVGAGVQLMEGSAAHLSRFWIEGSQTGVLIEGPNAVTMTRSTIAANVFGIIHPAGFDLTPLLDEVRVDNDSNVVIR